MNACSGNSPELCNTLTSEARAMGNVVYRSDSLVYANSPESGAIRYLNVATAGPVGANPAVEGSYHYSQTRNLSQSLPLAPLVIAPQAAAAMGLGKVGTGAVLGEGFDTIGQLTNPGNGEYRLWQTVASGVTGGLSYPFIGRSVWLDTALGASVGATNTAVTNTVYSRSDNVGWAAFLGGTFGAAGNGAANLASGAVRKFAPTYVGGRTINPALPLLLQDYGRPNPLIPYMEAVGTSLGNTTSGIPALAPGLMPEPPSKVSQ